jgi:hypothetical protein
MTAAESHVNIQPIAFANALALTTGVLAGVLFILRFLMPSIFVFVFNAQFFGADVASLLPPQPSLFMMAGEAVAFIGGAWGFGALGAVLYNRFVRTRLNR